MKKYKFFLIPIISVIIFSILFNISLNRQYEALKGEKDMSKLKHKYNHIVRDRGGLLKDEMHDEGDLMLLGSSELSSQVDQSPIKIFPFKGAEYGVSVYGRAHTQALQHSTIISNTSNINSKDKMAFIVSAQWFEKLVGIEEREFVVNFSELQFYQFFKDNEIKKENKIYYAKRILELLNESGEYGEERIYANLYYKDSLISKGVLTILKPYYNLKEYMLITKDKVQTIKALKGLEDKKENQIKSINWEEEYAKAESQGASKVTNNDINVDDEYYDTYLREIYDSLKGSWNDVDLLKSKELQDYKFFLDVCKDIEVKPLVILMPVNGLYYDHLGLTKDKRTEFYETIETIAKEKGFDVLNLQNKEYEKYYLSDVMHLGWKGWLNIDEEMYKYFNER